MEEDKYNLILKLFAKLENAREKDSPKIENFICRIVNPCSSWNPENQCNQ